MAQGVAEQHRKEGGYDYDFVKPPPDRLICKICQLPCRQAQKSECCGHVFCKVDLYTMRTTSDCDACPMCRVEPLITYCDRAVDREIMELEIYCLNRNDGCIWVGELSSIDDHLNKGGGCMITCRSCKLQMHPADMARHAAVECPCYCQYCGLTAESEVISAQHKEKCHLPCPNMCGVDIPRCDVDEHVKKCPLETVECFICGEEMARKYEDKHYGDYTFLHLQITSIYLAMERTESQQTSKHILKSMQVINAKVNKLKTNQTDLNTLIQLQKVILAFLGLIIIVLLGILVRQGDIVQDIKQITYSVGGNRLSRKNL
ncbi:TNF receptor-associated factor 4-like [Dysidea avara]|uniref:TNF receptor-associated factor 4-like n=1 Tax=Dysidea avara TaxID=196820 RepID=UPI0033278502